jgi:hypothetical protein
MANWKPWAMWPPPAGQRPLSAAPSQNIAAHFWQKRQSGCAPVWAEAEEGAVSTPNGAARVIAAPPISTIRRFSERISVS